MLILRLIGLLVVLGIGASMVLWLLTGNARYRTWAGKLFRVGVVVLLVTLSLFAIERVLAPMI